MSSTAPKPIRSPSYPSGSLSEAVAQVRKIETAYRLSPVDREAGAKLIGYSGLSGPANQTLAALAQYGLVERAGKGEMRVTHRAQAILHPNSEAEKRRALVEAAFAPQLFQELRERWPNMIPPEEGVITYLNRQGFNQSAIKPAARAYLQTLSFLEEAGASESHGASGGGSAESGLSAGEQGEQRLELGQGGVRAVIEQAAAEATNEPGFFAGGFLEEQFRAPRAQDGETEWMRNQLGSATKVRLLVSGDMGPREINKLIKLLRAQRDVLKDDDEEDDDIDA